MVLLSSTCQPAAGRHRCSSRTRSNLWPLRCVRQHSVCLDYPTLCRSKFRALEYSLEKKDTARKMGGKFRLPLPLKRLH